MIWHSDEACGFVRHPDQYRTDVYAASYVAQAAKYFSSIEEGKEFVESVVKENGWKVLSTREVNLL